MLYISIYSLIYTFNRGETSNYSDLDEIRFLCVCFTECMVIIVFVVIFVGALRPKH